MIHFQRVYIHCTLITPLLFCLCCDMLFFFQLSDISNSSFVQFQIWDFPGQIDFFEPSFDSEMIFGGCGALIFVIDAQVDISS